MSSDSDDDSHTSQPLSTPRLPTHPSLAHLLPKNRVPFSSSDCDSSLSGLPPNSPLPTYLTINATATLVNDALHGRENTVFTISPLALSCKWLYHNSNYRGLLTLVALLHLSLGVFEGKDSDLSYLNPDVWGYLIETLFCAVYIFDSLLILQFIGASRWKKQEVWIFALATVMILDVWCSHFFGHPGSYFKYPLTRFLRPAFFASRRRHLKACFMSMFKSMLACIPLIGILFVSIVFFATVGWIVFDATKNGGFSTLRSDNTNNTASNHTGFCSTADHGDGTDNNVGSCNDYFRTWPQSMYQVWILLMKVNMPDIMTPYLEINEYSSIFFLMYTTFTQFFFLRLILAASFTNYKRDTEEKHRRRLAFKEVAYMKAFALLSTSSDPSLNSDASAQEIIRQPRGRKGLKNLANVLVAGGHETGGRREVTLASWRSMMTVLRPDLLKNPWIFDLLFVASSNSITTQERFKNNPTVNFKEFCECCHSVNLSVKQSVEEHRPRGVEELNCWQSFASYVTYLFENTFFEGIMQFFLAISSITFIVTSSDKTNNYEGTTRAAQAATAILFTMIMLTTLIARGWKFWRKFENQVCFVVMIAILVLWGLARFEKQKVFRCHVDDLNSALSVLYLITFLRSALFVKFHPAVINTVDTIRLIMPMLGRIALVFWAIMYSFVMIGGTCFELTLFHNDKLETSNMSYYAFHYSGLNFANFWSSSLMLHQCLLGPQFPVFVEAVAKAHGSWFAPIVYFASFYVVVVVFVQNVVVAFILEAYMRQRGKTLERQGGRWDKIKLGRGDKAGDDDKDKTRLSSNQKSWLNKMYRGLRIVMEGGDEDDSQGLNSTARGLLDVIVFEFSRKPPHHELYDSVFHGDEMDPAKMKIKMNAGMSNVRAEYAGLEEGIVDADEEQEERILREREGELGGRASSVETEENMNRKQLERQKTDMIVTFQQRIVELEGSEERLRQALSKALRRKKSIFF